MSAEVVRKPPKPVPEKVAKVWAKEGKKVDWQRLMPPRVYCSFTSQVGGGADLLVVGPKPPHE